MWRLISARLLLIVSAAAILFGTLYPFNFSSFAEGSLWHLMSQSLALPLRRGDVIRNLILFLPFGYFAVQSARRRSVALVVLVILSGAAFSLAVEYAQAYLPRRTTSAYDVMFNTMSTALGALIAWLRRRL